MKIHVKSVFKMKDHLEVLINELKSAQLIIKTLQVEIKSVCTGPGNQVT